MLMCIYPKAVYVRAYIRYRLGKFEYVRAYCRSFPGTFVNC